MAIRRLLPILLAVAAGLAGCGRYPQSTLSPAGPVARIELHLFDLGLWIVGGVFAVVAALFAYVLIRFRERRGETGIPLQYEGNRRLELFWTLAPIVLLAILAVPTVKDTFALAATPPHGLRVTVTGHQWWWEFDYPSQGIVTADELHIPTGTKIDLSLRSADVIHSLWVPMLGGKTDLIPGRTNHMWLEADRNGVYSGQCAEFCGVSHANMHLLVVAQSPSGFSRWVHGMKHPTGIKPTAPLAVEGEKLFQTVGCAACHTIDGTPFIGRVGPNLTGFGSRRIMASMMPNTDADLARWLTDPPAVKPGADMPNLNLDAGQIRALIAYLRGLK